MLVGLFNVIMLQLSINVIMLKRLIDVNVASSVMVRPTEIDDIRLVKNSW